MTELRQRLAERFIEVNGDHPMTSADDEYVNAHFVALDDAAHAVRRLMLEGRLPLPSYLRSDGTEMVPADLFTPVKEAGGVDHLEDWFTAHWTDPTTAKKEWTAYLSGRYVCLRRVTPANMQRKDHLTAAIKNAPNDPDTGSPEWLDRLHALIDELDALLTPFTAYDRLRFGGPVSRDTYINEMRTRYPREPESPFQEV